MRTHDVDIAIVGAGTAGLNAIREAQRSGKRWVLIEPGPYGTTCARVGCMPSKLLIAAAETAHAIAGADTFGIRVHGMTVDSAAVMERVRRERDRFTSFAVKETESLPAEQRLDGTARFVDARTLDVLPADGGEPFARVHTSATVIATGSRPLIPSLLEAVRDRVVTSDTIFELEVLPRSMAVIGTGIVGLELGQAMSRLGVDVAMFDRSEHVGPGSDPEVAKVTDEVMSRELRLHMGADISNAAPDPEGVKLTWTDAGGNQQEQVFELVLSAAGRPPNLESLHLEAAGLELDTRGLPPWDPCTTQCGDAPIFLAGDANGQRPLLHEAGDEGRISGENAARYPDIDTHSRRAPLAIVFSDPQIALVGTPFDELDHGATSIGAASFENQGRSRVMAVNQGLMRIYAHHRDCTVVGAEMFGPRMEHMAHLLAGAVQQELSVQALLRMPVYHPTFEEGMRSALRDLAKQLKVEGDCRREDMARAPGT
ncbi:MAG: dihydrolipoyl dehydrogenase [Pseudomonadota bacterium]